MTAPEDLSARLYVRLYTSLLDDPDMVELSYAAVGVYAVALLLSKHTATDGRVPVKLLRRDAALRPGTPIEEVLEELAGAGLVTLADGVVTVRSWARYITPSAEIEARRKARQESARRANHDRWHRGAFEACQKCNKSASPSESESDPPPIGNGIRFDPQSYSHSDSQSESDSHSNGSDPDPVDKSGAAAGTAAEAAAVDLADRLMVQAGILDAQADDGIVRRVRRALDNGWPPEMLGDRAADVAAASPKSPRGLLGSKLDDLANRPAPVGADPPGGGSDEGWRPAWDEAVAGGNCWSWRGRDLTGLPSRTQAVIAQIGWMLTTDATGHDVQAAFHDAWLAADRVAPP